MLCLQLISLVKIISDVICALCMRNSNNPNVGRSKNQNVLNKFIALLIYGVTVLL